MDAELQLALEDVEATLCSFELDECLGGEIRFAETEGFDSVEDGQAFIQHQLEILVNSCTVRHLHQTPPIAAT